MRKLLNNVMLFIGAGILLSSCNQGFSVSKRHYRNGYHVEFVAKHPAAPKLQEKREIRQDKPVSLVAKAAPKQAVEVPAKSAITRVMPSPEVQPAHLTQQGSPVQASASQQLRADEPRIASLPVLDNKSVIRSMSQDGGSEGRSLLWLIVVILLIFWLVAFLGGGWGLGPLINVLLVIALVLFILWLLRLI